MPQLKLWSLLMAHCCFGLNHKVQSRCQIKYFCWVKAYVHVVMSCQLETHLTNFSHWGVLHDGLAKKAFDRTYFHDLLKEVRWQL